MKKLQAFMVAALVAGSHPAGALINNSKYGEPGELFISVWDEANARSYYKDLGISMTDFLDGKGCFQGDLSADPNFANFGNAANLVFNIAAVNALVRDGAGNMVNADRWGYLATSSAGETIFNASFSAIDNTKQKIQGYIDRLNVAPFTNAPGEAAEHKSGSFQASGLGYHGGSFWGASMGRSVGGNTEGKPGTALDFYFVNNANGLDGGKLVTKLGTWNLAGGKLSYSGTGTTQACSGGGGNPGGVRLTVAKTGTGSGTVISSPAGINCGTSCAADFASGAQVTLTATAAAGSSFGSWSGGACAGSTAPSCTVTMSAATTLQASFTTGGGTGQPRLNLSAASAWKVRQTQAITWAASQISPKSKVTIAYSKNGGAKFANLKVLPVTRGGFNWRPAKSHVSNQGVIRACAPPDPKKKKILQCETVRIVVQP